MNRERAFNDTNSWFIKETMDRNQEEFEIRMRISKTNRQQNDQKNGTQLQTKIYKTYTYN